MFVFMSCGIFISSPIGKAADASAITIENETIVVNGQAGTGKARAGDATTANATAGGAPTGALSTSARHGTSTTAGASERGLQNFNTDADGPETYG